MVKKFKIHVTGVPEGKVREHVVVRDTWRGNAWEFSEFMKERISHRFKQFCESQRWLLRKLLLKTWMNYWKAKARQF